MPDDEIEAAPTSEHEEEPEAVQSGPLYCRHCGDEHTGDAPESGDFLCAHCGRYQDSTVCPTCHQPARISLLPAAHRPAVHKPNKGKE